jgi:putative N6-adenine-specific DNA methylase
MERILAREIAELKGKSYGVENISEGKCGVHFEGDDEVGFAATMYCRTALKVMEIIAEGKDVRSREDLYALCSSVDYTKIIKPDATVRCDAIIGVCEDKDLSHSHYSALTVKNSVVDQFREKFDGVRPSVEKDPDLPLMLYMHRRKATLYRVWSGEGSMHKRGYRGNIHRAALRETTAAALLLASGWQPSKQTLCDPMCGSGTFAIEAALMAAGTAPGLLRCSGGVFGVPPAITWGDIDRDQWGAVWEAAKAEDRRDEIAASGAPPAIFVNDIHRGAIELAIRGAGEARVHRMIDFSNQDVAIYAPPAPPDLVVTNPPWDIRLEGADYAWEKLCNFAHAHASGRSMWTLCGNPDVVKHLRMRDSARIAVSAAGMDLRFFKYDVF